MKKLVRNLFRLAGFELQRTGPYTRADLRLGKFLEIHNIDTVLDVGANRGQFAMELLKGGFQGRVISFEALPHVYEELHRNARKYGDQWNIAPRCALSDEVGTVQFHVTNSLASSSMLRPDEQSEHMPDIFSINETINVDCTRLDVIAEELGIESNNIFLKLDVQGGEEKVLVGAQGMMAHITGLQVEMPLRRYYEGQQLAREMDAGIIEQGYELWDILSVLRHAETARLDYIDAIYFRNKG